MSSFVSGSHIQEYASQHKISFVEAMCALLDDGQWPLRFARNEKIVSADTLKALLKLKIFIAGAGGLGGEFAAIMARTGAGYMRICDDDRFEESNLNRQRFCTELTIGQPKVAASYTALKEIASYLEVDPHDIRLDPGNLPDLLRNMDLVVDCLDSLDSKRMLAKAAQDANLPYLHGSVLHQEGFAFLDVPGRHRLHMLYPATEHATGVGSILSHTVAGTAALMSALLVQWLSTRQANAPIIHGDWSVPDLNRFEV